MTCKRCGKHIRAYSNFCRVCTTIIDLEKAGYSSEEIDALLELMDK